jgi:hypothetical protein
VQDPDLESGHIAESLSRTRNRTTPSLVSPFHHALARFGGGKGSLFPTLASCLGIVTGEHSTPTHLDLLLTSPPLFLWAPVSSLRVFPQRSTSPSPTSPHAVGSRRCPRRPLEHRVHRRTPPPPLFFTPSGAKPSRWVPVWPDLPGESPATTGWSFYSCAPCSSLACHRQAHRRHTKCQRAALWSTVAIALGPGPAATCLSAMGLASLWAGLLQEPWAEASPLPDLIFSFLFLNWFE